MTLSFKLPLAFCQISVDFPLFLETVEQESFALQEKNSSFRTFCWLSSPPSFDAPLVFIKNWPFSIRLQDTRTKRVRTKINAYIFVEYVFRSRLLQTVNTQEISTTTQWSDLYNNRPLNNSYSLHASLKYEWQYIYQCNMNTNAQEIAKYHNASGCIM